LIGEAGKLLDHNPYTYCRGNPVKRVDDDGYDDEDFDGNYLPSWPDFIQLGILWPS